MTTILVTGATGKVGARLAPRLLDWSAADTRIRVLVRSAEAAGRYAALGAETVLGDLREAEARARALDGVDVVVNTAATFRDNVGQPEMEAVNRDAAIALGREAVAAGVGRFVQLSTGLEYGPGRGRPAHEDDELRAGPGYPLTKQQAEEGLRALEPGLKLVVLRLPFVYGEGDPHVADWLPNFGRFPAHQRMTVGHHADIAQAVYRAVHTPGIEGRTYNVADDAPVAIWDLVVAHGGKIEADPERDAVLQDPWFGIMDTARIRAELGYRPLYPTVWSAKAAGAL